MFISLGCLLNKGFVHKALFSTHINEKSLTILLYLLLIRCTRIRWVVNLYTGGIASKQSNCHDLYGCLTLD